jgi:hypothetical protein
MWRVVNVVKTVVGLVSWHMLVSLTIYFLAKQIMDQDMVLTFE